MENNDSAEVTLRIALSKKERLQAVAFIESQMRRVYGCEPPPTVGVVCTAHIFEEIVGSIVMHGVENDTPFPIEEYYNFDSRNTPFPFNRQIMLQVSRWISVHPGVSEMLIRTSFALAFSLGKRYSLVEAKPYSIKRLSEFGILCKEIEGSRLQPEKVCKIVGTNGMRYFTELPLPSLYMIQLK